jgi:nicotinamide-nucleotide amidase
VRAGIIVTGTELTSGLRQDRNGPWLARRTRELGLEPEQIILVPDRPREIAGALSFLEGEGVQLIITSGGLGPTADDLTAQVVAERQGREMTFDAELARRIEEIVAPLRERYPGIDAAALEAGTRKQAMVPEGASILAPVGTAPGLIVPPAYGETPLVLVLPGPPRELQPMFEDALAHEPLRALLARARPRCQATMRLFGIPESEIAQTLRSAAARGLDLAELEITTCLHRGEIEVTTAYPPSAQERYSALAAFIAERHPRELFSTDGRSIDQILAELLAERGWTIATAESCTGGMLGARLTDLAGSSRYFRGGLVVYSNQAKEALAGVPAQLIARHGAVSQEVAQALANGARTKLDADVGVGITGIAGPDGGSPEKPVGLVWVAVAAAGESGAPSVHARSASLPGGRADVRERATTLALHMVRRALPGAPRR